MLQAEAACGDTWRVEVEFARQERQRNADLCDVLAVLPDPVEYAWSLPERQVEGLMAAYRCGGQRADCQRVPDEFVPDLRPYGLCEYGGACLTVFGMSVRRALLEEHQA